MSDLKSFNSAITNVKTQEYLKQVLGSKADSFVANVTSVVAADVKLQECEPYTLMYAALTATSLGVPIDKNLGFAYIIPYKNNKTGKTEAQFQLGYKGFKQLALRSGQFATVPTATDVKEGELKFRNRLTGECVFEFIQDDAKRAEAKTIGYASYFRLINGAESTLYMSVEEIQSHARRYSQTYGSKLDYVRNSSKWTTDFDDMAKKTVLKLNLSKNAPLSIEMQQAIKYDQAVIHGNFDGTEKVDYVDNQPSAVGQSTAAFPKIGDTQPQPIEEAQIVEAEKKLFE